MTSFGAAIQGPPDPDMNDFAVCVSFDDDTMISIDPSLLLDSAFSTTEPLTGELKISQGIPKTGAGIKTAVAMRTAGERKPKGRYDEQSAETSDSL